MSEKSYGGMAFSSEKTVLVLQREWNDLNERVKQLEKENKLLTDTAKRAKIVAKALSDINSMLMSEKDTTLEVVTDNLELKEKIAGLEAEVKRLTFLNEKDRLDYRRVVRAEHELEKQAERADKLQRWNDNQYTTIQTLSHLCEENVRLREARSEPEHKCYEWKDSIVPGVLVCKYCGRAKPQDITEGEKK